VSQTQTDHEHDLVWVTSPGETQARQYCKDCGYRSEWQELPPELQPLTTEEAAPIREAYGNADAPSELAEHLDRGN
jgi:hypothetical protein